MNIEEMSFAGLISYRDALISRLEAENKELKETIRSLEDSRDGVLQSITETEYNHLMEVKDLTKENKELKELVESMRYYLALNDPLAEGSIAKEFSKLLTSWQKGCRR